ncbi:ATP binding protein, putative [Ricinus communis]|uniref:Kinesin-like protein n=1 Tax=Ricinus communis TaxID=3988 RepID=B9R839_RICCO|nr:ATP binding protein, putative [Ricinus communis]
MSIRGREETMSMGSGDEIIIDSEQEEKIFVSVRMRPLNEREVARNDICDWECINNNTIIFKSNMPDRSMVPTAYTFDRVFGSECSTKQVYEEGAKEIALAAVSGINSSIFAYGQTSSGKTYTMDGVTEYAVADIYEYMNKHKEREFVLKFSAMEIYNEAVRDLLSSDSTPLRVLDDPEKGTVVERLIEETLIDWNHLQELLTICEAQRQIGETSMNENSSRSHQVIRLTIESSAREYSGVGNSSILISTVHFVDLAGSERASQTLAGGARLKEGSHINRSLLTLGTVIRKLSKGKNGHIPYRDSKLTRILQNSLGGNARTAMICTISPSRSHVEQSRNTLLFASCANEVATNAQVNVVMSDKALVKQLRKELAKLESRLKSMESISVTGDTAALLREKELLIEKMDKEIKELTWQRDLAQSRVDSLLREVGDNRLSRVGENSASESSEGITPLGLDAGFARTNTVKDFDDPSVLTPTRQIQQIPDPEDGFLLNNSTPKFSEPDPFRFWESTSQENNEDICKEVRCIETDEASVISKAEDGVLLSSSDRQEKEVATAEETDEGALPSMAMQEEDKESSHNDSYNSYHALKQKIQDLHETISLLQQFPPNEAGASSSKALTWSRSKSRRSVVMTIPSALWYEKEEENENILPASFEEDNLERRGGTEQKLAELEPDDKTGKISGKYSRNSTSSACIEEETIKEINIDVDDTTTVLDFVAGVNTIAKPQSEEQIEASTRTADLWRDAGRGNSARQNRANSILKFERYRRKIIELWARCNVPLVHRSYFFLIFKGDPSDNVYLEVELRRLYFLKDTSARGTNTLIDTQIVSLNSSLKSLNREREHLARQLQKKFTKRERVELYVRWGIDLDTKQRSLQLIRRLWTDTKDLKHMRESSVLVAKLIGFVEPRYAPKEMFGLSFLTPLSTQKSSSWRDNMSSLSLL